jgi:SAM-dependent methyltransferase
MPAGSKAPVRDLRGALLSLHSGMTARSDFRDGLYARYASTFKVERGAASYDWWDHKLLPLLRDVPSRSPILDLGCGDGGFLAYLRQRGFSDARGIDVSAEQVALARARGVDATACDVFEALGNRATAQVIVAMDVLEHLTRDELMRLAPLLFDALLPGGRVLIQTANGAGLLSGQVAHGDLTHLTILTPESLGQLLRPCGFVDIRCYETGPVPIRVRGKLNVMVWEAVKRVATAIKHVETGKRQAIWTENFIACAFKP